MEATTPARCYKPAVRATATKGDVDRHGDVVDELADRLRDAVGPCVGFDPGEQVANVRADVERIRRARGLA